MKILKMENEITENLKFIRRGVPGLLIRLNVLLQLRSWSCGSWVWAPHQDLCWQLRAWCLLQILCLSLSLPLPHLCSLSLSLSLSVSKINIRHAWVAQSVECPTSAQVMISRSMSSSPCADSSEPGACFRFCVSLSLCPSPTHALSLSLKNK